MCVSCQALNTSMYIKFDTVNYLCDFGINKSLKGTTNIITSILLNVFIPFFICSKVSSAQNTCRSMHCYIYSIFYLITS